MMYHARLAVTSAIVLVLVAAGVPAAQTQSTQQQPAKPPVRRQRVYVPPKRPPTTGDHGSGTGTKSPQPPPRTGGGDGHPSDGDTAPPPPPKRPPDHPPERPPNRRPPFGIVIGIGGGGQSVEPQDDKKPKKDKEPKADPAPTDPRPLKYDERAYRSMADSFLGRGRVDPALRVIALLKEQEYYEYTGAFGDTVAGATIERPDYTDLAVRVSSKTKKKKAKSSSDDAASSGKKGSDAATGSWESDFEARADALLALEREAKALRAVPEASRTPQQRKRLQQVESDLARSSDDLETLLDGLERDLGSKDPRVKNLRASEGLSDALLRLQPGAVAIYTLTSDERFWTIVVSPLGRNAYATPIGADELERKVVAFRKVLVNPKQDPAPLARELYDIVLGKAMADPAMASARTLLWSFDGVLRYVPAAALNDGTQYLVARYRNVVFNRASIAMLDDAPAAKLSGVGLGVARQIAPYTPLPAVADELSGIFADGGTGLVAGRVLLDASFTEPALESALGGDNPVVHIATHFQLSPQAADKSVLLLGDGNLVSVGEIRRLKGGFRGVDLLTLSACDTAATGSASDGREVECFGTIAQERGAKAVVASLWPVNDRSTSLLMQTFYRLRAQDPTASRAELLRQAQEAVRTGTAKPSPTSGARLFVQEEPEAVAGQPAFTPDPNAPFAHPYYWAPFVMIGSAR